MSRPSAERLIDILDAIGAIRSHLRRGEFTDGLVFDAVRVRLIEIREAVKSIPAESLEYRSAIRAPVAPNAAEIAEPAERDSVAQSTLTTAADP